MPTLNNIQTTFTRRTIFFYSLLLLFAASTHVSGKNKQKIDYKPTLSITNPENVFESKIETAPEIVFTVITEQDPNGIFWGLRDTLTGKLILDYTYQKIYDFKDGFAVVFLNGKFGLIDKNGKEIISPAYVPKAPMECGFIAFEYGNGPVLIFDNTGRGVLPLIYGITGLLPCEERITYGHYQYGMLNFDGDTILPFKFMNTNLLPEGFCLATVVADNGYDVLFGLYDLNGNEVLPHAFESINGFYCERAIVKKNGKIGVIDEQGKELFYTEYARINRYHNDHAMVFAKDENGKIKVGFIDKDGNQVVPPIYPWSEYITNFVEGFAALSQNGKYGFVDTSGQVVIPFKYDRVSPFINGIAKVWIGWRHVGYINFKGEEIIAPDWDDYNLNSFFRKFLIGRKNSVHHVFDYTGKEIATLSYEKVERFDENDKSFLVSINNNWGTLDSNFRVKIPIIYESLETTFPDKIAARINKKIGLIDPEGREISPFLFDWIEPFEDSYMKQYENGLALVGIKEKTGLINGYGNLIIPVEYDEIEEYSYGLAVVKLDNKYGFVNANGKEIIPAIYDQANPYNGFSAEVTLKGETLQIDSSGNRLEYDH